MNKKKCKQIIGTLMDMYFNDPINKKKIDKAIEDCYIYGTRSMIIPWKRKNGKKTKK